MGDSYFNRFKVTSKVLSKMELSKACEFVELQMLLPRRYCVDTQVKYCMAQMNLHSRNCLALHLSAEMCLKILTDA